MGCATGGNRSRRPGLVSWPRPLHDTCGLLEARTSCWYGKFRKEMFSVSRSASADLARGAKEETASSADEHQGAEPDEERE